MRSLEEISQSIIAGLASENSPATDVSPGGVLYSLIRSNAAVHVETDLKLNEVAKSLNFATAAGADLEALASNYGLRLKPGQPAIGFVLLSHDLEGTSVSVSPGQVFTHLLNGLQFVITGTQAYSVGWLTDVAVPVACTSVGVSGNLSAGTSLYTPSTDLTAVQLQAVVGYKRTSDGTICGDLSGGTDQETDVELWSRLQRLLTGPGKSALDVVLEFYYVRQAWLVNNAPGIVTIYVLTTSPLSDDQITEMKSAIAPYITSGSIVISIAEAEALPVDISLRIRPYTTTTDLNEQVRQVLEIYLSSLSLGEPFNPEMLISILRAFGDFVEIMAPTSPIQVEPYQFVRLGKLETCYV